MVASIETLQFQAETKHLLDLMINSLYTTKDIFLRELISNASDALDRLRFEALTRPELTCDGGELEIRLEADRAERTLTIHDNGIGMSREEVVSNIGTIAESGTRALSERLRDEPSGEDIAEFIGQFGVGFYSAFMVAERVTFVTRRADEATATRWESGGDGHYTISETVKEGRGTSITLHLKPVALDEGIEDYTDKWILARIVKRYSNFISYPIRFRDEHDEIPTDEFGHPLKDTPPPPPVEYKLLNSMKPIWSRPEQEVTEQEFAEFYQQLSHDTTEPLQRLSLKADGRLEYQALLFIPTKAPYDLYYHAAERGLRLYAKGVLIAERCEELLPRYLRFIKGVVDTYSLPLNISRQMLQQDRQLVQIQKWLTKKVLNALHEMHEKEHARYLHFWEQFGRAFKEGVSADYDNRERLLPLLLFESSHHPSELTDLKSYVSRMRDEQKEILYLTGESRSVVENSPHLEASREKGYEVLYLTDPVDELLVDSLHEYEGKRLKSLIKGTVKLSDDEEGKEAEQRLREEQEQAAELLSFMQQHLDAYIKEVRLTNRLTTSPVCLVGSEIDYSPQMERLLQMGKGERQKQRRIMELNPRHELFAKMRKQFEKDGDNAALGPIADLLFGYGLLAEGSELPDPVKFNRLVADLMVQAL